MSRCNLCPRRCGVDRSAGEYGICGQGSELRIARVSLHPYEEPPISGARGSGTIFFEGCSLCCVFCQNRAISRARGETDGRSVSVDALCEIMLGLRDEGAHNINLVTPTHFADKIAMALREVKPTLGIPVVYNSSGYERTETLRMLEGLVDVYMPDLKYGTGETAKKYSSAEDYPEVALAAISEMYRQTGAYVLDSDDMLIKGVLVRHLVLPSCRADSRAALDALASTVPASGILLSVMSQYTPEFAYDSGYRELGRRVTSFEYRSVADHASALGFEGFTQGRASASAAYTPKFK